MATVAAARSPLGLYTPESEGLNTLPDPRSPSPASAASSVSSPTLGEHHPDLSAEVATLSTKLINAINHQTTLDDALQQARHELEEAREKLTNLERAAQEHTNLIGQGLLIRKEEVDRKESRWREDLSQEKQKRDVAEKEKRRMESELENLTAHLFEEANEMVASARKETESSNNRIAQLQNQLRDTETLLASQQEQLQGLKVVVQSMSDRDENASSASAPSTPGLPSSANKMSRMFDPANLTPVTPGFGDDIPPEQPLFFSQFLTPVLRSDLPAFQDFQALLRTSKPSTGSRVSSGSFSALNAMSIGLGGNPAPAISTPPLTPKLPPSAASNAGSPRESLSLNAGAPPPPQQPLPPLKEAKYFKRALPEDIETTLRLDIAPGLSWLAKRSVLQAVIGGFLTIEPLPPAASKNYGPVFACALCAESRKLAPYQRRHQFRIADDEPDVGGSGRTRAQRWPLCDWCLGRVRSVCDFVAFLRMCQAGVWRAEPGSEREKEAWEEGVRLREKMFWARVGGGVVPNFVAKPPSPRVEQTEGSGNTSPAVVARTSAEAGEVRKEEADPFREKKKAEKRVSIGKTTIETRPSEETKRKDSAITASSPSDTDEQLARQFRDEMKAPRDSLAASESAPSVTQPEDVAEPTATAIESSTPEPTEAEPAKSEPTTIPPADDQKEGKSKAVNLSVTIPGSFEP